MPSVSVSLKPRREYRTRVQSTYEGGEGNDHVMIDVTVTPGAETLEGKHQQMASAIDSPLARTTAPVGAAARDR